MTHFLEFLKIVLPVVGTLLVAYLTYRERVATQQRQEDRRKLEEIRHQTNSMQAEMMTMARKEGKQEEKDDQKLRDST